MLDIGEARFFEIFACGVAVDPAGRVWLADRRSREIIQLSSDGKIADRIVKW